MTVKEIEIGSFVSFHNGNKKYRGVVTESYQVRHLETGIVNDVLKIEATSRYIKKDSFWKLYQEIWEWKINKIDVTLEQCDCDRVIHSDFINDRGGITNAANCPDCYWDCVS